MPQRELFMTHDLFELKDGGRAVYRHLEAMMRFCQEGIPSFKGPFIGKKAKKRPVGGGASSGPAALPGCYGAFLSSQAGAKPFRGTGGVGGLVGRT